MAVGLHLPTCLRRVFRIHTYSAHCSDQDGVLIPAAMPFRAEQPARVEAAILSMYELSRCSLSKGRSVGRTELLLRQAGSGFGAIGCHRA